MDKQEERERERGAARRDKGTEREETEPRRVEGYAYVK